MEKRGKMNKRAKTFTIILLALAMVFAMTSCDQEGFSSDNGILSLDCGYSNYSRTLVPHNNDINYWEMKIYKATVDPETSEWTKASGDPEVIIERSPVWTTKEKEIKAGNYIVEARACYEDSNGNLDQLGYKPTSDRVTVTKGRKTSVSVTVTLDGDPTDTGSLHATVAYRTNIEGYTFTVLEASLYKLDSNNNLSIYTSTKAENLSETQQVMLQLTEDEGVTTVSTITDNTLVVGLYQLQIVYKTVPDGASDPSDSKYIKTYKENVIIRSGQDTCFRVETAASNTVYLGYDKNFVPDTWYEFKDGVSGNAIKIKTGLNLNLQGSIVIPSSLKDSTTGNDVAVETIATLGFKSANKVTSFQIPTGVTSIGDNAFEECALLEHVEFPSSLTAIGSQAFLNCTKLKDLTFPSSLQTIGAEAFYNNTRLQTIVIPDGTRTISRGAFGNCTGVRLITFPSKAKFSTIYTSTFDSLTSLTSLSLPEGITTIQTYGCSAMTSLETLALPSTLSTFHYGAFAKTYSVTGIEIASSNKYFQTIRNTADSEEAGIIKKLSSTQSLSDATLVYGTHNGASNETVGGTLEITLPAVKVIDDGAYDGMFVTGSNVTIRVPDTVTTIGDFAFAWCTMITDVYLPSTLESISASAFHGCSSSLKIHYEGTTTFADLVQTKLTLSLTHPAAKNGNTYYANGSTYANTSILAFYNNSL